MYKLTSFDLKLALMEKYRFQKQNIIAEECHGNDIVSDDERDPHPEIGDNKFPIAKSDPIIASSEKTPVIPNET